MPLNKGITIILEEETANSKEISFMKFRNLVLLELVFILMLASFALAVETVNITSGEWPPYMSKNIEYYGLGSRIVSEAFALEGVNVSYGFFPRKRSLYEVNKGGEWDGSILWFRNSELEKDFYISDPIVESRFVFFHLKDRVFQWNAIEDLKKYNIGGTLEYDYGEELSKAEKEGRIILERVPNDDQNFKKLLFGRIDAFPQDVDVGQTMMKNLKSDEMERITFNPKPLRSGSLCLILSKKNQKNNELLKRFNRGLKKLKSSGEYNSIMQPFLVGKVLVVANKSVNDAKITKDELKSIFLGKTTRWSDGKRIIFTMLKNEDGTEAFLKYYIGKSYSQFNDYWGQMLFTGKGQMPPSFDNTKNIAGFIAKTDGAVGYILNEIPTDNLKIIEVRQ